MGESDLSVALLAVAATIPDAPSALTLVEAQKTWIQFSWSINYNGGIHINDFEVDWKIETNDLFATILSSNN